MKWSEISRLDVGYGEFDETERAIKGFFLASIGVDLENLPDKLLKPSCEGFDDSNKSFSKKEERCIHIEDIAGTTHSLYGNGTWLDAFLKEHKASEHILRGDTTRGKYFRRLKKHIKDQSPCIELVQAKNGSYYVGENGNHRVTFYKLMYLADLANGKCKELKKYWLYANVKKEE